MNDCWQLRVFDNERVYVAELTGPAEIGRQQSRDETQPAHKKVNDVWRVVIAPLDEVTISRRHLEVKPLPDGRFLLANKSANQVVGLPDSQELQPGASCQMSAPVMIRLGSKTLRLQVPEEDPPLASLPMATLAPGSNSLISSVVQATIGKSGGPAIEAGQLTAWIQAFLGLLQSAAGTEDFYVQAARALVDLVKLDSGRVLFRVGQSWQEKTVQALSRSGGDSAWRPSSRVMMNVLREKKTFWQVPDAGAGASTRGIDAVVAAPILDRKGEIIGALYGERRQSGAQGQPPISPLEAMLVEVLASGVAAGLARVEQEQAAMRARLQMEQFFGKRLATKLENHPELLEGRDTDISVLFCDIRGFSRISERLGPARTVEWVGEVMGDLSQCVQEHEGVVIDFIGDELMAIWSAPEHQPDHAVRACRTALAMFASLPRLHERWQEILQGPFQLGIGINSGTAQVGNVGSKIRLKYGAMGNNVNLASRVQGATKHLKTSLLITDATRAGLDDQFHTRRLCQVRVVNIAQPVTLFELVAPNNESWAGLKLGYEQALDEFTKGEFRQACRILGRLILDHPNDGPALLLLSRAVACLVEEPNPFDPVMVLGGK
jgi:adenylate cyclase